MHCDSVRYKRSYCSRKKIKIDSGEPYTGIGWTKSRHGIPEFYVTIADEIKVYTDVGLGRFLLMAFNTTVYVADRASNSLVKIECYYNETSEYGCQVYDKFESCYDNKTKEIRERIIIIKEEGIII